MIVPWLVMVVPGGTAAIVALMVIVTLPAAGTLPFQVTVFVAIVATEVPEVAVALTSVRLADSTSRNSLPGLSAVAALPELERVTT